MEKKDMYTLKELYGKLDIPLAELGRQAGISEVTIAKIRDGHSARRSTINSLLRTFAKIYDLNNLSIENVQGIIIKDKLARQEQVNKSQQGVDEQVTIPAKQTSMPYSTPVVSSSQKRHTTAKKSIASEVSLKKRTYKPRKKALPEGCLLAADFAQLHNVKRETFRDHLLNGLIDYATDTIPQRDYVAHESRPNPAREKETERYLTADQQAYAIQFWRKHKVTFEECNQDDCACHTTPSVPTWGTPPA